MPWTYEQNPSLEIIEVVYTGDIAAGDLQESTSHLISLEKKKGMNRFLVHATEMKLAAPFSLMDIYDLPTKQYIEEKADRRGRVAVLPPTSSRAKEAVQFYETACRTWGWSVKVFGDRQEAIRWLMLVAASDNRHAGHNEKT